MTGRREEKAIRRADAQTFDHDLPNTMHEFGRLFDCGDSRDGSAYRDVSDSQEPEVLEARRLMAEILADKPVPVAGPDDAAPEKGKAKGKKTIGKK